MIYREESDYGQDLLDLIGAATGLCEDREYTPREIYDKLREVREIASTIQDNILRAECSYQFSKDYTGGPAHGKL